MFPDGVGPLCSQRKIVFPGPALVAMPLDGKCYAGIAHQPARLLLQYATSLVIKIVGLISKLYSITDIDPEIFRTARRDTGARL